MELRSRKVLVVGLARTGLAAANFLLEKGAQVTVTDLRVKEKLGHRIQRLKGMVEMVLGQHRDVDFTSTELIIVSPGVPTGIAPLERAREHGIPIWSEIELAHRFLKGTLIGVTGTNGKTTTVNIIGALLKESKRPCVVAGNIGIPLLEKVGMGSEDTVWVVELSSFQLETTWTLDCQVAVVLNVTPDHLDRHQNFEDYWTAKTRILLNQKKSDFAVFNREDNNSSRMAETAVAHPVFFSSRRDQTQGVFLRDGTIWMRLEGKVHALMKRDEICLKGEHNLENVMAASAAGFLVGVQPNEIGRACRRFPGVEHRLEWILNLEGISFYNDSKATNVESASRAIEALDQPLVLIMGGKDKGADFGVLRSLIKKKVRHLVLLGEAKERLITGLRAVAPVSEVDSLEEGVEKAFVQAIPGDAVLLSPACASFDMFKDYEERGMVFKALVTQLAERKRL